MVIILLYYILIYFKNNLSKGKDIFVSSGGRFNVERVKENKVDIGNMDYKSTETV